MKKYDVSITWIHGTDFVLEVPDDYDKEDVIEMVYQNESEIRDSLDIPSHSLDLWVAQDDGPDKIEGKTSNLNVFPIEFNDIDVSEVK